MNSEMQQIRDEVENLKKDMRAVKKRLEVTPMTSEDEVLLEEAFDAHRRGETTTLRDLKKELGV